MKYNISDEKLKKIFNSVNSKLPKDQKYKNFKQFSRIYKQHKERGDTNNIQRTMIYEKKYSTKFGTVKEEYKWVKELLERGYDVPKLSYKQAKLMTTREFAEIYQDSIEKLRDNMYIDEYNRNIAAGMSEKDAVKAGHAASRVYISNYIFGSK